MRRTAAMAGAAGLFAACAALAQAPAAAPGYQVRRSEQPLAGQPTRWQPAMGAPLSDWRPAGSTGSWQAAPARSTFGKAAAPDSALRLAEVPPARLARTRALLTELNARPTPQKAIVVDLPADVLFDFDKADLRPDAEPALARAAELLQGYPEAPVRVRGHTDARGSDAYNEALSLRRAQRVAERLAAATGVRTLQTEGLGRREPVAPNTTPDGRDDPEGRQKNRRVEIVIGPRTAGG
ncbi:OmpA family protein [Pseudacidovorax sp. NFM-22]|uniref:OmpA family protein n=1 Tax=Pseudacidovorax sp. NFM-22 TaxID=2744469 RepID=UPI001F3EA946|nr:OmpA family protein [Pseudacidovorax sp. NFM-22]